jgi:hypothetical protein
MIKRSSQSAQGTASRDEAVSELLQSLRQGVEALKDPQSEATVGEYFERHPNYNCDLIHVAAVACGFQAAKERNSVQTAKTLSQRP